MLLLFGSIKFVRRAFFVLLTYYLIDAANRMQVFIAK